MNIQASTSEDVFHLGIKALVRSDSGDILLLLVNPAKLQGSKRDYWDLPGGRVQKGQTVEETLAREVQEETGLTNIISTKPLDMVLSNIRIPIGDDTVGLILGVYECVVADSRNLQISDEHIAYGWFSPAEAAKRLAVKYPAYFCAVVADL